MLRSRLIQVVEDNLRPLQREGDILTGTMLQNYSKWGLVPRPDGRKYHAVHLAHCMVLSLMKNLIPTQSIHTGILLQTNLMRMPKAYNAFAQQFDDALHRVASMLQTPRRKRYHFPDFHVSQKRLAVASACQALAFKIITEAIIENEGFAQKKEA